jgi:hypothetical protein
LVVFLGNIPGHAVAATNHAVFGHRADDDHECVMGLE